MIDDKEKYMQGYYEGEDVKLEELVTKFKGMKMEKYDHNHLCELLIRERERTQSAVKHLFKVSGL